MQASITLDSGSPTEISAGLAWHFPKWSRDCHVLLPGAVYAGNRFPSVKVNYSPRVPEALVGTPAAIGLISDVPRLRAEPGPSHIEQLSGDLAIPALAIFDPIAGRGWVAVAAQASSAGEYLWEIEENAERTEAWVRLTAPGVRSRRYSHMNADAPSADRARVLCEGETITVEAWVYEFPATKPQALFDALWTLRTHPAWSAKLPAMLPFSEAARLIIEHYERDSWIEIPSGGFYATDCNPHSAHRFQTGWCGGGIATYPLLGADDPRVRDRARLTLHALLTDGASPSGFLWGKRDAGGRWIADFSHDAARPYTHRWNLVRRNADMLFFGLKQVALVERHHEKPPASWLTALRNLADAFVRVWRRDGRLGHFTHALTGEIVVDGSASGALAPAGLMMAAEMFDNPEYARIASEIGDWLYRNFTVRGVTTGGPGDALQCPDSESAAALVESFVALFEAGGEPRWRQAAEEAARQLATWVMPYDYAFPPQSEFGRHGLGTRGTVFANAQNKHSAPGLCTHSGECLFQLFRHTGDRRYLELLRDIARALPQFVSRPDRVIVAQDGRPLPSGWINERVNTSDWDNNLGGVFHGSTWCEVSMLLTWHEVPGVYAQPDTGYLCVLDHVDASWGDAGELEIVNRTAFDAELRVVIENSPTTGIPAALPVALRVFVSAGAKVRLSSALLACN